ncbi:stage III sporulation protein AD [Gracilibacillus halophilus YIM-C55.5]|uniref:Stage III sporulation protein AD n=1 Tax=Gracilibacillus halophilus YIM-C55.5 TaxID=1308866 RepID=N4WDW5_9BACI|nr:stage III sporulation protein AD [Gracilibacillus halophilus]ENH97439.1 stage III sporulation protein AD [Gracilibacillus halophilus YIM-C55.5]
MEIFEVVSMGMVASVLYLIIKDKQPAIAYFIVILTVISLFLYVIQYVREVLHLITYLGDMANIHSVYIKTILQIIGISYVAEIGANIVRDAGLESVALKIELVGKVFILILAVPIFRSLVETIIGIFPM